MAFQVTRSIYNGYRCCCFQDWDSDPEWFDSREEALSKVPREVPAEDSDFDFGLNGITVVDGSTGKEIASVTLSWPAGYRGSGYEGSLWSGWIDPGEGNPLIEIRAFKGNYDSWEDCCAQVKAKGIAQRKEEAQRQLEAAQKALSEMNPWHQKLREALDRVGISEEVMVTESDRGPLWFEVQRGGVRLSLIDDPSPAGSSWSIATRWGTDKREGYGALTPDTDVDQLVRTAFRESFLEKVVSFWKSKT